MPEEGFPETMVEVSLIFKNNPIEFSYLNGSNARNEAHEGSINDIAVCQEENLQDLETHITQIEKVVESKEQH